MTREEHIEWAKKRAIEEMDFYNDPSKGIISMMSDLTRHPETYSQALMSLCALQLLMKPKMTKQEVIDFINGFR